MVWRIDDTTAAPTLPADPTDDVGTPGYFIGGNPATSTPPTRVRYWWLNMVQESLINPVLAAGLALAKDDMTQLTQAIKTLPPGRKLRTSVYKLSAGGALTVSIDGAAAVAADGTFNPLAGTNAVTVTAVGAGGGGGGSSGAPSGSLSAAGGGAGGTWARDRFTDGFAGVPLTVGAGGTGGNVGTSTNATAGGTTSFGTLLSVLGGGGAPNAGLVVDTSFSLSGGAPPGALPSTNTEEAGQGSGGGPGIILGTSALGGEGGASVFGGGGARLGAGQTPNNGLSPGSGGAGACNGSPTTATSGLTGALGATGMIIVEEES